MLKKICSLSISLCFVVLLCSSCSGSLQPESVKTVAAFEIQLPTEKERQEFLEILHRVAADYGFHVDTESASELSRTAKAIPRAKKTIHATVWRGEDDSESIAVIMDKHDHLGFVWIAFSRGEDQQLNEKFRDSAMGAIKQRWPNTLSLPVMPNGAIPLREDLIKTPSGYILNSAVEAKYGLQSESTNMPRH